MKIKYLGHSGFSLELAGGHILIDPFLTGNPLAQDKPESFSPSHIVLTHGHGDHYGDTEAIAVRSGATVVSSFEIVTYVGKKNLEGHPMNVGGSYSFPFGRLKFTPAWHSNSLPDGTYGGMPMGVLIDAEDKRLYHAGDTALFKDMELIGKGQLIDVAMLPIGDNFTMGPDDALSVIEMLTPSIVIPIHYDTFPPIRQDVQAFKARVEKETQSRCIVLAPGESFEL